MNTHEFIVTQVEKALLKEGFSGAASFSAAQDALDYYKQTACFKKSPVEECLKHAKAKAKELDKSLRKR